MGLRKTLSAGGEAGETVQPESARSAGSTLLEAAIATAIIALALAIAYPPVSERIETGRLQSAASQAGIFVLDAQHYADRHRQAVLLRIDPASWTFESFSEDGRSERVLQLPSEFRIAAPAEIFEAVILPGAALPELHFVLASNQGARFGFRIDPSSGTLLALGGGG